MDENFRVCLNFGMNELDFLNESDLFWKWSLREILNLFFYIIGINLVNNFFVVLKLFVNIWIKDKFKSKIFFREFV